MSPCGVPARQDHGLVSPRYKNEQRTIEQALTQNQSSNILNLPFRRTHQVDLPSTLKQYISSKYDQHPDTFTDDLKTIDEMRTAAVTVLEPHPGGVRRLQSYAAQLVWMVGKFPIDVGAEFAWYGSLGYSLGSPSKESRARQQFEAFEALNFGVEMNVKTNISASQNNLRFELANVLFNLSVLHCQLAVTSNRNTADGLKAAANHFCLSAGVLEYIKSNVIPEMRSAVPEDMDHATLECLEQLMLAQAQECFWMKAVKDGLKDASIAKLAAKVSDLYSFAGDWGIKSDAISSEWIHHMTAKHHHFAAAAQYRAACDCLEKRRYGEEVARLKDSLACANEGLKEARYVSKAVLGDLNGLRSKVQDDLQRAEKDNDMIYLMPVPPKPELKTLERASMVSAKVPKEVSDPMAFLGPQGELGKPLFAKLVPYAVHMAASVYANRRDHKVGAIVEELDSLNARIHDLFRSLNLPGSLQALEKPLGLPPGLVSHAEDIRQQNGPNRLKRSMEDVDKLKHADRQTFQEGIGMLESEARDDEAARAKYGTDRWIRVPSEQAARKHYGQVSEINGYFKSADSSDAMVRDKVRDNEKLISLLNGTDSELEDEVPSSRHATKTPKVEREASRLRESLNSVNRLESRRRRVMEALRCKAQADDVNPDLLREASRIEREYPMQKIDAAQFETFFDKRLERYNVDEGIPKAEEREQHELLSRLAEANTALTTARRGDGSTREREQALQKLENAYFAYKEIIQNLDVGRKFYNDLAPIVSKFRDSCRGFAYERRAEATQLEVDITTALPMANLNLAPTEQPVQQRQEQQQQAVAAGDRYESQEAAVAAPKPVKPQQGVAGMWSPELGIKFGGANAPPFAPQANGGQMPRGQGPGGGHWDPSKGVKFG